MIENTHIKIEHNNISFQERVKYYLFIFLGVVSTFGLFQAFSKKIENFLAYISAISVSFGLLLGYKLYKTKRYVRDFYSDSKKIEICYLNYSDEKTLTSSVEEIDILIKNTSSRSSFNFEIQMIINDQKFSINKDFDWSFSEMKYLFEYIKHHKKEKLTENEEIIISRIKEEIKKHPF